MNVPVPSGTKHIVGVVVGVQITRTASDAPLAQTVAVMVRVGVGEQGTWIVPGLLGCVNTVGVPVVVDVAVTVVVFVGVRVTSW
jgi:hypothetical protein